MVTESITRLIDATRQGDRDAVDRLFRTVYGELKVIARSQRRRLTGNDTINTTALVHEVFIKLSGGEPQSFANRVHFYATAAKAMRQVLINYASQQRTAKRGGDCVQVPLEDAQFVSDATADELLNVEQLLNRLDTDHPRRCRIVECRVFAGMTIDETAEALDISPATVKREWQIASAALYRDLQVNGVGASPTN